MKHWLLQTNLMYSNLSLFQLCKVLTGRLLLHMFGWFDLACALDHYCKCSCLKHRNSPLAALLFQIDLNLIFSNKAHVIF